MADGAAVHRPFPAFSSLHNMNKRCSTGSTGQTRSILHYFKPASTKKPEPVQKSAQKNEKGTLHATSAVIDLSSGDDEDEDGAGDVHVLSEIKCNSPGKSDSRNHKLVRKSAVSRSSTSSFASNELITSQAPSSATNGRDTGSYLTDDDVQMGSQVSPVVEDMDLDMSDFLDVLVDEKAAADRQDDLMLAIAISSEQESQDFRNSSQNDYKLSNFRNMIDFVLNEDSYSHLLNSEDWDILQNVTTASIQAQRLFIR